VESRFNLHRIDHNVGVGALEFKAAVEAQNVFILPINLTQCLNEALEVTGTTTLFAHGDSMDYDTH
jgi:hypothetical protein